MIYALKANGYILETGSNQTLSIRRHHNLFSDGLPDGEYSLPINFPDTSINRKAFEQIYERLVRKQWAILDCDILILGGNWKRAKLRLRKVGLTSKGVQGYLLIGSSYLSDLLKNTKMNELDAAQIYMGADQAARQAFMKTAHTSSADLCFPLIHNRLMFDEDNKGFEFRINNYDPDAEEYILSERERSVHNYETYINCMNVPCFSLKYMLGLIADLIGLEIAGSFLDFTEYDKIHFDNLTVLNDCEYIDADYDWELSSSVVLTNLNGSYADKAPVVFLSRPTTVNSEGPDVYDFSGNKDVARIDQLPGKHQISWDIKVDDINLSEWSVQIGYEVVNGPTIIISEYQTITTQGSGTTYHFDIEYDSSDWEEYDVWFYVKFTRISGTGDMDITFLEFHAVHTFLSSEEYPVSVLPEYITPANHMPDQSVSEWLDDIRKLHGFRYNYDLKERKWYIDRIKDVLDNPKPSVLSDHVLPTDIENQKHYLVFGYNFDAGNAITETDGYKNAFASRYIGDPAESKKDYSTSINTLSVAQIVLSDGNTYIFSTMEKTGYWPAWREGSGNDIGRVFIHHGFLEDVGESGNTAPIGHYSNYNAQSEEIFEWNLQWNTTDGLYQFWEDFALMMVNAELYDFDQFFQKYQFDNVDVYDTFHYKGQNFVFMEQRIQLTPTQIRKTTARAYLIPLA